ncbi:hypothetical protein ACOMHN_038830 [Nucella lapillus]
MAAAEAPLTIIPHFQKGSLWPDLHVMPTRLQSGQVPWTQSLENCEDGVSLEGLLANHHVESSVLATHWSSAG